MPYNNPGPMAAGNPGGGMYDDAEPMDDTPKEEGEKQEGEEPTAVIPKALLAGKKFDVGDEVVLKIKAFQGDEVVVAYSYDEPDKGGKDEGERPPPPPPPGEGGDDMAGMMG